MVTDTIEAQAERILAMLPPRVIREAESLRSIGERERWVSGDTTADMIDELVPQGYAKGAVRLAIARLYHVTEPNIADRERVSRRVSQGMRLEHPGITWHYWRACSQAGFLE